MLWISIVDTRGCGDQWLFDMTCDVFWSTPQCDTEQAILFLATGSFDFDIFRISFQCFSFAMPRQYTWYLANTNDPANRSWHTPKTTDQPTEASYSAPLARHVPKIWWIIVFFFMFIKVSTSFEDRFTHPHPKKAKNYKTLPAGLEPATLRLTASRSNQLSYGSMTLHDDWGSAVAHASLCVRVGGEVVILRTIRNGPHCESRAWWQNPDDMNVQMHSDAKTKIALNKRMSTCSASS